MARRRAARRARRRPPDDRPGRARGARRRRPARAGVREPARERLALLGRPAGVGPGRGAAARACSCHVVDQGPGMQPAERERIFEPFYRGRATSGDSWTGSGLGLAIAKGFVEANGGAIAVESLPGSGHELHRSRCPCSSEPTVGAEHVSTAKRTSRPRVLVCDDEQQILRALRVILRDAGFEALPAHTGEEALDVAARRSIPTRRSSTCCCPTSTGSSSAGGCASGPRCR